MTYTIGALMFTHIFFDLDGTLTDPAQGITNSFIHALKYFGLEIPSYEELCKLIGPPLPYSFESTFGFDHDKAMEAVAKYREYFSTKGLYENKVYDGIPELLQSLKEKGRHLVVATSKPEEYSIKIIEHFNLSKYFDYVCGSNMDESRSKKEEVIAYALQRCGLVESDKPRVLMIGDRLHDIEGAKKNGLKSCGVLFGYGSRQELEDAGADYIVKDVIDLHKVIE
ncbi:MAG: HAD family hydrolase [Treponema sp.]|nr:HAD family hydrolase [Treponema sp.]